MCCSSLFRECRGRFFPANQIQGDAETRATLVTYSSQSDQRFCHLSKSRAKPNPMLELLTSYFPRFSRTASCPTLSSDFRRFCVLGLVYFARDFPELSYSSNEWKIRFRSKDCISLGTSNFLPRTFLETIKKQTANSWKSAVQNIKAFVI